MLDPDRTGNSEIISRYDNCSVVEKIRRRGQMFNKKNIMKIGD